MSRRWRLLLGACMASVVATIGCAQCAAPGPPPDPIVDIPLAVRVHSKTQLSLAEAKTIATASSQILQIKDWAADVACAASLSIESLGAININIVPDSVVASRSDFDALFGAASTAPPNQATPTVFPTTRQVRVVSQIYWCDATIASAAGCADEPGYRIVVARRGSDREGELWAHEVGHTKDLHHRINWLAVMFEAILPDHKEVDNTECGAFRK